MPNAHTEQRSYNPACRWTAKAEAGGANNVFLLNGASTSNACGGGTGYSSSTFQPLTISPTLSYGFAGSWEIINCCKCFSFTWISGAGAGKSMTVQVVNSGGVNTGDFDISTPGGDVGGNNACTAQYLAPITGWQVRSYTNELS